MTASADIADISSKHTIRREIARRRTFAIVSHPDAGKTTLTEKFLLYGGALHLADQSRPVKPARHNSDWMELEKKRGISISSTVLQFDYNGFRINLLTLQVTRIFRRHLPRAHRSGCGSDGN